ncbi:MAG: SDR family oxidoreductase [Bryobacteraceae bacterium]
MIGRLEGLTAVVTGGGRGIGAEIARRFSAEGAAVVVADIDLPAAEQVAATCSRAIAVSCDVASAGQVDGMFARAEESLGGVDILINNAYWSTGDTTISELDEGVWDRTVDVCMKGPFLCTRRAIPAMKRRGGGSIVTISSVNALYGVGETAYTAAKGGLIAMMRLVAAEYGRFGIRSNVICPGTIATETCMEYWSRYPEGFATLRDMYPLGRIGQPGDVAAYALFLASAESAFVTGSVAVVDGGLLAGRNLTADAGEDHSE